VTPAYCSLLTALSLHQSLNTTSKNAKLITLT
jgi:hypothetical protein